MLITVVQPKRLHLAAEIMSRDGKATCSVLVIGGSGFLGQHVISLLQSRAPFVTEIRTLDIVPYENKLDHEERVPVQVFTGSVTDVQLVREACRGVNLVIHVAAVIDATMFPDYAKSHTVNVEGPSVVVKVAADMPSVYGYIFSSSVGIHYGDGNEGRGLTEDTPIPARRYHEPYATTKVQAERLVLDANGPSLKTTVIRPSIMYGDLNWAVGDMLKHAVATGGWLVGMKTNSVVHQHAYVGNVAWGFICAAKKLNEQRNEASSQAESETGTGNTSTSRDLDISGEVFIIADDTKCVRLFDNLKEFIEAIGLHLVLVPCPLFILALILNIVYIFLRILQVFGVKVNVPLNANSARFFYFEYIFSDRKAWDMLDYKPVYDVDTARKRTIDYYRKTWNKLKYNR